MGDVMPDNQQHSYCFYKHRIAKILTIILLLIPLWIASSTYAQDCGIADSIQYPVDTNNFTLVQDFAISSPRHQGRYHTGEDWYGGRNQSYGQPISAAARGRVTYSYPLGWGRDGGVVIIEHIFSDGAVAYTQYGHMEENTMYRFPAINSCVEIGQIIGVITDARPAQHLHFEVRVSNPDTPGPGYTWYVPQSGVFLDPKTFITTMQARLK